MAGSMDDKKVRLIDLDDYVIWVLWKSNGECSVGSNGTLGAEGFIQNLRSLADELERQEREERA